MVSCSLCFKPAAFLSPHYCKDHFFLYIEEKVKFAIKRFHLIGENERIAVAVSGGKDSQTVLSILHTLYGNRVCAIAIDEGIPGYRDNTLEDLEKFCRPLNIPYHIYSFQEAFGKPLERFLEQGASACRSCGVLRRHLLNTHAAGFDKLATGHNLDDECQSIVMNFLKSNLLLLAKLGPVSGITERAGFTPRIKPLYLCTEKEIAAYAFLQGFPVRFRECPHASDSFRSLVRDLLNNIEHANPGTKRAVAEHFLALLPRLHDTYSGNSVLRSCTRCGSPAVNGICQACKTVVLFSDAD